MGTNRIARGVLTVCCPHLADEGTPDTLVIEGGPLTLSPPIGLMQNFLGPLAYAQEVALQELHRCMSGPGVGEIRLVAHPDCSCEFLVPLDARDTKEALETLADDLRESTCGYQRLEVTVEILEASDSTEPNEVIETADSTATERPRRQSGERLISSTDLKVLRAAAERRSA